MGAVTYLPFATGAGANVSETGWGQMARHWLGTGVLHGELNELRVYGDSSGMQVKVNSGRAWVEGYFFQDDGAPSDSVLSIAAANPSNPRIDLVVLRLDHTAASIAYVVLTGTPAASPVAPTLTQVVGGRWEQPLALVNVAAAASTISATNVVDQRNWAVLAGPKVTPTANMLVNGGFEIKQRVATTFTTNNALTLDMWKIALATSTVTVSQITSTVGAAGFSAQIAYVHSASGSMSLYQPIEHYAQLNNQLVTFAVTLKSTVNGTVRLIVEDGVTTTFGSYNVGTGSQRLSLTVRIGNAPTALRVGMRCDVATCTVEVNDAMLVTGPQAVDFVPLPVPDDLARCLRYYEFVGGATGSLFFASYAPNNGATVTMTIFYQVPKAVTPTLTKVGTWTVNNCAQPTVGNPSLTSCTLSAVVTLQGGFNTSVSNATDGITVEANI